MACVNLIRFVTSCLSEDFRKTWRITDDLIVCNAEQLFKDMSKSLLEIKDCPDYVDDEFVPKYVMDRLLEKYIQPVFSFVSDGDRVYQDELRLGAIQAFKLDGGILPCKDEYYN